MTLAKKIDKRYTVKDYLAWDDDGRWEIIGGLAYDMSPAPGTKHQQVVLKIVSYLENLLGGKTCRPFMAPTDVVLSEVDVVQPDVFVVCDPEKITDANIQGAPDLVIEVLSPSTALKDTREKKALYEKSGVKEFIVIHPLELYVERFVLRENGFGVPDVFGPSDELPLCSLENSVIPLLGVFPKTG